MPTRNRPELLERALGSALEATAAVAGQVEVTVSDGSDGDASGQVVRRLLADWPGGYRYVHNRPALSLPGNINRAMQLATGEWILQLHDDDYLLPGAGPVILETIRRAPAGERILLFGVDIVDVDGVSPSPAAVPPRALPGAGGGPAPGPAQLLVRADARRGGPPGGLRGGRLVRHDPRRALRHRHVGAAVRPLRRALPARHHLRLHHRTRARPRPGCGTGTPSG